MASQKLSLLCIFFLCASSAICSATTVSHDGRAITIDGKRRVLLSGSIHYPRSTPQMWPDLIRKAKEGGLDVIETYVFWNAHEPSRRQYDFSANLDLIRFLKTIQEHGLYAFLRIGPYVCAEWNYGGFPVWLHNMPGIEFRTLNKVYMDEMQNFTTLIVDMAKDAKLFAGQGGPIILSQIENEYGNVMGPYGDAGKEYIKWCADMADSLDIGVPWVMCQQPDAPQPMLETCNGFYCDQFTPTNPNTPKMWTENWTGWFKSWGARDPRRTAEDLAYAVARFFQTGGTFQNYYMYHGGTNFGREAGGPYITTTYDYNAPLDEYGSPNQPKYGHLKRLHDVLHAIEETLTHGHVSDTDFHNSVHLTKYATKGASSCFISNKNETHAARVSFQGKQYDVPAWSVSILPDCVNEAYNTAKVTTQTSTMVQTQTRSRAPLKWSWKPENMLDTVCFGFGKVSANEIVDQKTMADDKSDYLWYMTTVYIDRFDLFRGNTSLRVNNTGHGLHAYVNGHYLGSQYGEYGTNVNMFEGSVKLRHGKNIIALLSATVGLKNYESFFDEIEAGIVSPVQLVSTIGDMTIIKDLSGHKWSYKVGLNGFDKKFYSHDPHRSTYWRENDFVTNRSMTWYKASFETPLGSDPVVVDLNGMGKGVGWVNGHDLGRYWPSYIAPFDGCNQTCHYRGAYSPSKCNTGCDKPTQRWYHVPRSFLKDSGANTLVLFEEFGGNPSNVSFQTVVVGSVCAHLEEGNTVVLSCGEQRAISAIKFASFGSPQGACGSFAKGSCDSEKDVLSIIRKACVGKRRCSIEVWERSLGETNCRGDLVKKLAVEAVC